MSELATVQRLVTDVLIPEAWAWESCLPSKDESLPMALELYYLAFAMKKAYRPGGLYLADRFATRMGLIPDEVHAFAVERLNLAAATEDAR